MEDRSQDRLSVSPGWKAGPRGISSVARLTDRGATNQQQRSHDDHDAAGGADEETEGRRARGLFDGSPPAACLRESMT